MIIFFHRFDAFGKVSKERLFVMEACRWAPRGSIAWILDRIKSPGMVKVRENGQCTHEVAVKLIEEKRQELKDGTSRKDLLSLLGLSPISISWRDNVQFSSQSKCCPTTRLAIE